MAIHTRDLAQKGPLDRDQSTARIVRELEIEQLNIKTRLAEFKYSDFASKQKKLAWNDPGEKEPADLNSDLEESDNETGKETDVLQPKMALNSIPG